MSAALTRPEDFIGAGLADPRDRAALAAVAARYSAAMSPRLAALARAHPQIARQYAPDARELTVLPQERADPIGDDAHSPVAGLVHRYPDRVLLKIVSACPVYCRFCFRRESVGAGRGAMDGEAIAAALDYLRGNEQVWEVILTGGDPFVLSPRRLAALASDISSIPHIKILRLHTRAPMASPELVTREFIAALQSTRLAVYVAVHANHPAEFDAPAKAALAQLADAGVGLVSQSVLLRGVNDDVETLEALMRAFVEARVKPYYLHHPDLAPGTGHFRLSLDEGRALYAALCARVSGLARPAYVLDIPGGAGKIPVAESALRREGDTWRARDAAGRAHDYADPADAAGKPDSRD
ncbi:MAG: lysine-2,3-aminomutase-like protein [Hyphomicrobiales bacterium]|nr:lysine-2,3-aminomutase-like protein [Hyphomicrobiales bacterium]